MLSNQTVLFFGDRVTGVTARAAVDVIYPRSSVSNVSQGKAGPDEIPIQWATGKSLSE